MRERNVMVTGLALEVAGRLGAMFDRISEAVPVPMSPDYPRFTPPVARAGYKHSGGKPYAKAKPYKGSKAAKRASRRRK